MDKTAGRFDFIRKLLDYAPLSMRHGLGDVKGLRNIPALDRVREFEKMYSPRGRANDKALTALIQSVKKDFGKTPRGPTTLHRLYEQAGQKTQSSGRWNDLNSGGWH